MITKPTENPHASIVAPVADSLVALDAAKAAYDAAAEAMAQASREYEAALATVRAVRADLDAHFQTRAI